MKLRVKFLSGFLFLALMLLVAGIWSVAEFSGLSRSVSALLHENYRSINASHEMIQGLEQQDGGIFLLLLGKWEDGRTTLNLGDSLFRAGFEVAQSNITESGEQALIDSIKARYNTYVRTWEWPIVDTQKQGNFTWYASEVHHAFLAVRSLVESLSLLNSTVMYESATSLEQHANRAIMPGIIAIIGAFVFTFLFGFFLNHYYLNPLLKMKSALNATLAEGTDYEVEVPGKDEIQELNTALISLTSRITTGNSSR